MICYLHGVGAGHIGLEIDRHITSQMDSQRCRITKSYGDKGANIVIPMERVGHL